MEGYASAPTEVAGSADLATPKSALCDVERFGSGRLARGIESDFLHLRFERSDKSMCAILIYQ
jgi:hypothetical protein